MNRSIRITSLFSLLLILVLVANLTWIQAFRDDDLAQNPYIFELLKHFLL